MCERISHRRSLQCISFVLFHSHRKKTKTKRLAYEHNLKCVFVCHSQLQQTREREKKYGINWNKHRKCINWMWFEMGFFYEHLPWNSRYYFDLFKSFHEKNTTTNGERNIEERNKRKIEKLLKQDETEQNPFFMWLVQYWIEANGILLPIIDLKCSFNGYGLSISDVASTFFPLVFFLSLSAIFE